MVSNINTHKILILTNTQPNGEINDELITNTSSSINNTSPNIQMNRRKRIRRK